MKRIKTSVRIPMPKPTRAHTSKSGKRGYIRSRDKKMVEKMVNVE